MEHEHLRVREIPQLRRPVLLAAFAGWNDASQAATHALETLVQAWNAPEFADIDPEEYYDFTEARPNIVITPAGRRALEWPATRFYFHRLPDSDRDALLVIGVEPNLRWRSYCDAIIQIAEAVDTSCLVTLGGLLSDVPHTVEPRLTGFATAASLLPQLQRLGVRMSSYEGPTGILGVLHDAWQRTDRPALSLWGHVPHYISASPNPQIALALLHRVRSLLGVELPLGPLTLQAQAFRTQIEEALEENPEASDYVRQLEETYETDTPAAPSPGLIQELEEFLRSNRPPSDDD